MRQNLPVLLGLLGIWNSTFLGHETRAILPYAQALLRFPAHIQQLDMESNGKRVGIDGSVLPYRCGEIIFGEPGTNGQHSFYQLIHQGRVIPTEFIGYCSSPNAIALEGEVVSNHDELMSNFFAQPDALACGKTIEELIAEGVPTHLLPHKEFPGNRPSLSLLFPALTARSCGQLLALYEHRVAVQGFIWGINSFDQWGVELGKVLASRVRGAVSAARKSGDDLVPSFNPSTTSLLRKYLSQK
jgi:glucose-6-phosphate isomerase